MTDSMDERTDGGFDQDVLRTVDRFIDENLEPRAAAIDAVAALERAVRELGFKGAHIHPHGCDLPPDHAYYFPF